MPDNAADWAWFTFFSIGALGGILSLADRFLSFIDILRTRRHVGVTIRAMESSK